MRSQQQKVLKKKNIMKTKKVKRNPEGTIKDE